MKSSLTRSGISTGPPLTTMTILVCLHGTKKSQHNVLCHGICEGNKRTSKNSMVWLSYTSAQFTGNHFHKIIEEGATTYFLTPLMLQKLCTMPRRIIRLKNKKHYVFQVQLHLKVASTVLPVTVWNICSQLSLPATKPTLQQFISSAAQCS